MGDLLHFPLDRACRPQDAAPAPPAFFFDITSPFSYLAAERVERVLGDVEWVAVDGRALHGSLPRGRALARMRERAEARAAELRLPLVWPEPFPLRAPGALRAAAYACELGAGAPFALAAARLAFCGGFQLDDPEIVAEAAAAAAVPLGACLEAVHEEWRDEELGELASSLRVAGVGELPVFRVGGRWCEGEHGLAGAAALITSGELARRPLAPVG